MKRNRVKLFEEFINEQDVDSMDINQVANELKALGAKVKVKRDGIVIDGDWEEKYSPYHEFIIEITGRLVIDSIQDKDFLRKLETLGSLDTKHTEQDKDFLINLETLGVLYTHRSKQDKDFLRNLKNLEYLATNKTTQDKDFLKNTKIKKIMDF